MDKPIYLSLHSWFQYQENWLSVDEATELQSTLLDKVDWQQGHIKIYGKTIAEPRLTAWFGENEYTYSGKTVKPAPMLPELQDLLDRIKKETNYTFNGVFLNLYRNGKDSVGWHSDDEIELGKNPVIASVSLGTTRKFLLKDKTKYDIWTYYLKHGSLFIMGGTMQKEYFHSIPKEHSINDQRINLTFRYIINNS